MDEAILFPSPNWFQVSGLAVTNDDWLVYGGPTKSLCVLEPLPASTGLFEGNRSYKAHVLNRAHLDKIVSVDISPEWPLKRALLTGSADGSVKQWTIQQVENKSQIKSTHSHEVHVLEKEEVSGVGYSTKTIAVSVGCYGNLIKWDLNSNVVRTCNLLKNMKPVCMACSPHIPLQVAIGTKQGVVYVVDLNDPFKLVYKVRGQDDEIINLSWCPRFEVVVKKTLKELDKKVSATERMNKIRSEAEKSDGSEELEAKGQREKLEESGVIKNLPEDSFDESIVVEDDPFDIYKDHEADEFGHKKYVPEEIMVKIKKEEKPLDYLEECMKLKDQILKMKNQPDETIESLVQALDRTHVDSEKNGDEASSSSNEIPLVPDAESTHIHKHLLATVGKYGGVRIWSKTGKLVGSCGVPSVNTKNPRNKSPPWATLLWLKSDLLLIGDARSQLLECNPLKIDCKNKLQWQIVHTLHKRGLSCIASSAPRVQSDDLSLEDHPVWTISQDRTLVCYSLATRQKIAKHASCGGFLYTVQPCPYDAGKIAVSVGDGAVRVWETSVSDENGSQLNIGNVNSYWQNVQGKVLTVAWHPVRENLLAFSTGESRVGLIDTSRTEKPARVLLPALNGGIYSLYWGEENNLYACGGGDLVVYNTSKPDEAPSAVAVSVEGQRWEVCVARWQPRALLVGSCAGAVAALTPHHPHTLLAATFIFSKMIYAIDWHPLETSNSTEESPFKNLIAVCSQEKQGSIVILEYCNKEDGSHQFQTWKTLVGHSGQALHVSWNPHHDGQLLTTSQDSTVRIWNVSEGVCISIFGGHASPALSAAWCAYPQLATKVISGGGDCCLRVWDINDHPADSYIEIKQEVATKRDKKKKEKKEPKDLDEEETDKKVAATNDGKLKVSKKFLLPLLNKQITNCNIQGARKLLNKYLHKNSITSDNSQTNGCEDVDTDFIKMFGNINEVNEVLDKELERHLTAHSVESWIMLSIFRGHIDSVIRFASERDLLCTFLLSVAPCVSLKYWKDTTQLYLAQIDRLIAKNESEKLNNNKNYGGPVYRKVAILLSIHDIKGAVDVLVEARLFNEAYILCRTRYMDSIAEQTLIQWAQYCACNGMYNMAAVCYLALGNLSQAATVLGKTQDEEWLCLAAELAKTAGQNTFADHISEKREQIKNKVVAVDTEEVLEQLPTRFELLMKENGQNGDKINEEEKPANGV
ncbi:gem-associated protein 5-like [Galleria mellonella]|uniref:Gem-associated protein 5-like n=1 Tax=Galleria mellonella TaxID=7137 RepID=A0A6J1X9U0_GALME|nr:gem-associated protein 5-like [Galleria mellonella]